MDAFVAQFALLDIFTCESKHFGRLKWLVSGGTETSPVELPASERSLILGNLFASVYYAAMRARFVCGQPWKGEAPVFKDVFSGAIFSCCYQILKDDPESRRSGKLACGLDDQRNSFWKFFLRKFSGRKPFLLFVPKSKCWLKIDFWPKIEMLAKNQSLGKKSKFWSKTKFRPKIEILAKKLNLGQKSKFWPKNEI